MNIFRIFLIILIGVSIVVGCQKMPTLENISNLDLGSTTSDVDTQEPFVNFVSPKDTAVVNQVFSYLAFVSDNKGISRVVFITPSDRIEIDGKDLEIVKTPQGIVYSQLSGFFALSTKGTNIIKVFAVDSSGNYSFTNSIRVIVDVSNPTVSIVGFENTSLKIVSTNFELSILASDDTEIDGIFVSVNKSNYARVSSSFTFYSNLVFVNNSTNTVSVYVKDASGKLSEIREVTVIVDQDIPVVFITEPSDYVFFNTSNIVIKGSVSTSSGMSITKLFFNIDNSYWEEMVNPPMQWTIQKTINMQSSNIVLRVKVRDSNNRESSEVIKVFGIDYTKPTLSINTPANDFITTNSSITISGTAGDNIGVKQVMVRLNNGNYEEAIGYTSWSKLISLVDGTNSVYVKVIDFAGNFAESSISVIKQVPGGSGGGSGGSTISFPGDDEDPRDWRVYFVMTDRFVDGFSGNNNIYGDEYRAPNNDSSDALRYYNGGDFKGLINNLDYIKNMGFNAIWITPVVKQPPGRYVNSGQTYDAAGYHGYWGYDFDSIDPHLESPGATFDDLIREAHNRGIKIILDIVPNHAHGGDAHPSVKWFNDRLKVKFDGQWWEVSFIPHLTLPTGDL
ncbi:MAG: alpha-amylase family glycosyl hydrolase, partial [Brevinematales bacterium]|nr:alpha-amylase family glycosyl hydrolase [Brevinematales bacterium]